MKTNEQIIKKIISKILDINIKNILNESSFLEDFGADSLDVVELIMALEDKFNIEISDEDAKKINTVQQIINYIENKNKK